MEELPQELILHIIKFLGYQDVVRLQLVSRHLYLIARDNELWRERCFEESFSENGHRQRDLSGFVPNPIDLRIRLSAVNALTAGNKTSSTQGDPPLRDRKRTRALANWDPSYSTERVDWYGDYIARHGPISMSWLDQYKTDRSGVRHKQEIRGLGLYRDNDENKVVAPLEDGSVAVWNYSHKDDWSQQVRRGTIHTSSRQGLLFQGPQVDNFSQTQESSDFSSKRSFPESTFTGHAECVSVDSIRHKAYFAVGCNLNEVDLNTLQLSAFVRYPNPISTLSKATFPVPLTIGSSTSLYLHDPRESRCTSTEVCEKVDNVADFPASPRTRAGGCKILLRDAAPVLNSGPLSIQHFPAGGHPDPTSGEIYVAGRFPSILIYDRRNFPKLRSTIHSGASLCSLASIPFMFKSLEADLMRHNELSIHAVNEAKSQPEKTLIAVGEYKGKGSLELYGIGHDRFLSASNLAASQMSIFKNRVSASSSKILSVATHGTRIVISDGNGQLRWLERDGSTPVRRWTIKQSAHENVRSGRIFRSSGNDTMSGGVARKIVATNPNNDGRLIGVDRDELLVWTGDRIGVLEFKKEVQFDADVAENAADAAKSREERMYNETMRRALERQADEARFMIGLGLR